MRCLPDSRLYTDIAHCLAHLRGLPAAGRASSLPRVPVHFYWRGPFGAKPALAVKSLLAVCDRASTECWLWLDTPETFAGAAQNPHLGPLLPLINLRTYRLAEEMRHTPFADQAWVTAAHRPAELSDIARLVLLHNYGGIYSDLDALFLRDLIGLREWIDDAECCFQWSYLPRGTHAFCRLQARGRAVLGLMHAACAARSAHPTAVLTLGQPGAADLLMLPVAAFSPLWLHVDRKDRSTPVPFSKFADFFRDFGWFFRPSPELRSSRDFFPGAFTYHWHNLWSVPEHADSYAGMLDRDFNRLLRAQHPGLAPLACFGDPVSSG